jgi:hypothetical protein
VCLRGLVVSFLRWGVVVFFVLVLLPSIVFLYMAGATLGEYLAVGFILIIPSAAVFACNPRSRERGSS